MFDFVPIQAARLQRNYRQAVIPTPGPDDPAPHPAEPHVGSVAKKLNWLRAGVMGADDGILSIAGIVVGVAAASAARGPIFTAGIAALAAGALSMAVGEYVSVSTQRDTERALLGKERTELTQQPHAELEELAALYESKGLTPETAQTVAKELTAHDAFAAHIDIELGINPQELTNPWQAAFSSAVSFTLGAVLPLLAILLPPPSARIAVTVVAVLLALAVTGWISARAGRRQRRPGGPAGHRRRRAGDGNHVRHRPLRRRRDRIARGSNSHPRRSGRSADVAQHLRCFAYHDGWAAGAAAGFSSPLYGFSRAPRPHKGDRG